MKRIPSPRTSAQASFLQCIGRIQNRNLRLRLSQVAQQVVAADSDYQLRYPANMIHQLPSGPSTLNGLVTVDEMVSVYTGRMAKRKSAGREIYDEIMSLAPQSRCPFCGVGTVTTLDHVLAKTNFPCIVVAPMNLVPSCKDCNGAKLTKTPSCPEEAFIHPYFDNVETDRWLKADVSPSLAVTYKVISPPTWQKLTVDRIAHQFRELKLAALYASNASSQLVVLRGTLEGMYASGGIDEVRTYLEREAAGYASANLNSWQSALYLSIADNVGYIDGGFRNI